MMIRPFSYSTVNFFGSVICLIYLGTALLLPALQDLSPCPLCILQRWIFSLLFLVFFVGSFRINTKPKAQFYGITTLTISLLGIVLSGRHLWLIYHPAQEIGVCAPNLFYLFKQRPMIEGVRTLFWGSGDCATMAGTFWGISLPLWTLIGFLLLAIISLWQTIRNPSQLSGV